MKYAKKSSKKPTSRIARLEKSVKAINKRSKHFCQFKKAIAAQNLVHPCNVLQLMNPAQWSHVFDTDLNLAEVDDMFIRSIGMDIFIKNANEDDHMMYEAYLVSLREENATKAIVDLGEDLSGLSSSVTSENKYWTANGYDQHLLNKKFFRIHKMKRFNLAETLTTGQTSTNLHDQEKRWYWKLPLNGLKLSSGNESFADLTGADIPAHKRYYVVVFNNNSILDLEYPDISINSLITGFAYV